jgi:hypothetical protein
MSKSIKIHKDLGHDKVSTTKTLCTNMGILAYIMVSYVLYVHIHNAVAMQHSRYV